MATASVRLPDGTAVQIEGTPEEVAKLLALYGGASKVGVGATPVKSSRSKRKRKTSKEKASHADADVDKAADLSEIVNLIKNSDEAEAIEAKILDKVSQVNRILLPLYIVHEYMDNTLSLTSGEVSQITTDLGIPVSQPNASTTLSGTASRYVIGDKVRRRGQAVRYKLSRRGVQYVKSVLGGKADAK